MGPKQTVQEIMNERSLYKPNLDQGKRGNQMLLYLSRRTSQLLAVILLIALIELKKP